MFPSSPVSCVHDYTCKCIHMHNKELLMTFRAVLVQKKVAVPSSWYQHFKVYEVIFERFDDCWLVGLTVL